MQRPTIVQRSFLNAMLYQDKRLPLHIGGILHMYQMKDKEVLKGYLIKFLKETKDLFLRYNVQEDCFEHKFFQVTIACYQSIQKDEIKAFYNKPFQLEGPLFRIGIIDYETYLGVIIVCHHLNSTHTTAF